MALSKPRWHEDDLAGRLLKEMAEGGESWDVISLPALAEDGTRTTPLLPDEGCPKEGVVGASMDASPPDQNESEPLAVAGLGSLSPEGTKIIAQGKAKGRHPGYTDPNDPLPEGEQPQPCLPLRVSAVQTSNDPLNRLPGQALCPERYDEKALES